MKQFSSDKYEHLSMSTSSKSITPNDKILSGPVEYTDYIPAEG